MNEKRKSFKFQRIIHYSAAVLLSAAFVTHVQASEVLKGYSRLNDWKIFQVYGGEYDGECRLYKDVNRRFSIALYANANEGFGIGVLDREKSLLQNLNTTSSIKFDNNRRRYANLNVRHSELAFLRLGFEEDGPEFDFRKSNKVSIGIGQNKISTSLVGSSKALDALWSCVTSAKHPVYVSASNDEYILQCKPKNLILQQIPNQSQTTEPNIVTLHSNCVAESSMNGYGRWAWANGGFGANFLNADLNFPRAEIYCKNYEEPEFEDQCGSFSERVKANTKIFTNENGLWVSGINKPVISFEKLVNYAELIDQLSNFDLYGPDQIEGIDTLSVLSENEVMFIIRLDERAVKSIEIVSPKIKHSFNLQLGK